MRLRVLPYVFAAFLVIQSANGQSTGQPTVLGDSALKHEIPTEALIPTTGGESQRYIPLKLLEVARERGL